MKAQKTNFRDLYAFECDLEADKRGFQVTCFEKDTFEAVGIQADFEAEYVARSTSCVVRGLYYHSGSFDGLLVSVSRGTVWLAAIDLRSDSKTYRQMFSCDLSENNVKSVWIPAGFAYGYCVPGFKTADIHIHSTSKLNENTQTIHWNDPELAIPWPIDAKEAVLSSQDESAQKFSTFASAHAEVAVEA